MLIYLLGLNHTVSAGLIFSDNGGNLRITFTSALSIPTTSGGSDVARLLILDDLYSVDKTITFPVISSVVFPEVNGVDTDGPVDQVGVLNSGDVTLRDLFIELDSGTITHSQGDGIGFGAGDVIDTLLAFATYGADLNNDFGAFIVDGGLSSISSTVSIPEPKGLVLSLIFLNLCIVRRKSGRRHHSFNVVR